MKKITKSNNRDILVVEKTDQNKTFRTVNVMQNCCLIPESEESLVFMESGHTDTDYNCRSS